MHSKTRHIVLMVLLVLLGLGGLFSGVSKAIPFESMAANMERLHFSLGFTRALGIAWIVLSLGLIWERFRRLALAGMLLILSGGIAAHIAAGDGAAGAGGALGMGLVALAAFGLAGGYTQLLGSEKKKQDVGDATDMS